VTTSFSLVLVMAAGFVIAAAALRASRQMLQPGSGPGLRLRRLVRVERARLAVRVAGWRGVLPGATVAALVAHLDDLARDLAPSLGREDE